MININPVHNENYNCFDDIIATLADWKKYEYQLSLIDAWDFQYEHNQYKTIGENLGLGGRTRFDYLKLYHGIVVEEIKAKDSIELLSQICYAVLNKQPIYINIDTFWCPWDKNYKKYHNYMHNCLIVDFDKYTLRCTDPFYLKKGVCLSYEHYFKGCFGGGKIEFVNKRDCDIPWQTIVSNTIERLKSTHIIDQILSFANDIEVKLDYDEEIEDNENFWHSKLIFRIGRVILDRKRFAVVLTYLQDKCNIDLLLVIQSFERIVNKWSLIRAKLVKEQLMPKYKRNTSNIACLIKSVAFEEEKAASDLLDIISE